MIHRLAVLVSFGSFLLAPSLARADAKAPAASPAPLEYEASAASAAPLEYEASAASAAPLEYEASAASAAPLEYEASAASAAPLEYEASAASAAPLEYEASAASAAPLEYEASAASAAPLEYEASAASAAPLEYEASAASAAPLEYETSSSPPWAARSLLAPDELSRPFAAGRIAGAALLATPVHLLATGAAFAVVLSACDPFRGSSDVGGGSCNSTPGALGFAAIITVGPALLSGAVVYALATSPDWKPSYGWIVVGGILGEAVGLMTVAGFANSGGDLDGRVVLSFLALSAFPVTGEIIAAQLSQKLRRPELALSAPESNLPSPMTHALPERAARPPATAPVGFRLFASRF